jgi:hypothetical protein
MIASLLLGDGDHRGEDSAERIDAEDHEKRKRRSGF